MLHSLNKDFFINFFYIIIMKHFYNNGMEFLRKHSQSQTRQNQKATNCATEPSAIQACNRLKGATKKNKQNSLSAKSRMNSRTAQESITTTAGRFKKMLTYIVILVFLSALLMVFSSCGASKLSNPNLHNPQPEKHETKFRIV